MGGEKEKSTPKRSFLPPNKLSSVFYVISPSDISTVYLTKTSENKGEQRT